MELHARLGSTQAVIRPGSGVFSGIPVRWECSSSENGARVEAVFYAGPSRSELFDERTELTLACGVEVLPAGRRFRSRSLHGERRPGKRHGRVGAALRWSFRALRRRSGERISCPGARCGKGKPAALKVQGLYFL